MIKPSDIDILLSNLLFRGGKSECIFDYKNDSRIDYKYLNYLLEKLDEDYQKMDKKNEFKQITIETYLDDDRIGWNNAFVLKDLIREKYKYKIKKIYNNTHLNSNGDKIVIYLQILFL